MAIVIPEDLEDLFESFIREQLNRYHYEENHADHNDCQFCGVRGKPWPEHEPDCWGLKLLKVIQDNKTAT